MVVVRLTESPERHIEKEGRAIRDRRARAHPAFILCGAQLIGIGGLLPTAAIRAMQEQGGPIRFSDGFDSTR